MPHPRFIIWAYQNPRNLFLLDGIGALISAFLLGVVLSNLEEYFGVPSQTLYILAAIPVLFACYDWYNYRNFDTTKIPELKVISILNTLYCCISIAFAIFHADTITILGFTYVFLELVLVLSLAWVEFNVAKHLKSP